MLLDTLSYDSIGSDDGWVVRSAAPARDSRATCASCPIRSSALCGRLDDSALADFVRHGRRRHVTRGETVVYQGDEDLVCASVITGALKLSTATADGREQIVGLLYASDFLGRPYGKTAASTITALADSELCVMPRRRFEQALGDHPRLQQALLHRMLDDLDHARGQMMLLGRKSAEEKVASLLLDMARRLPAQAGAQNFELPLTRAQIADVLGLTIETVSRQMTRLRSAGMIDLSGPGGRVVAIRDWAALVERTERA